MEISNCPIKYDINNIHNYNKKIMNTRNKIAQILIKSCDKYDGFFIFGGYLRDKILYDQSEDNDNLKIRLYNKLNKVERHDIDFYFDPTLKIFKNDTWTNSSYETLYLPDDFTDEIYEICDRGTYTTCVSSAYNSLKISFRIDGIYYGIDVVRNDDFIQNDFNVNAICFEKSGMSSTFKNCSQKLEDIKLDIINGKTIMNEFLIKLIRDSNDFVLAEKNECSDKKYSRMDHIKIMLRRTEKISNYGYMISNYESINIPKLVNTNPYCKCQISNSNHTSLNIYYPHYSNMNEITYMCHSCGAIHVHKTKRYIENVDNFFDIIVTCQNNIGESD